MCTLTPKSVGPLRLMVTGASGMLLAALCYLLAQEPAKSEKDATVPMGAAPIQARASELAAIEVVPGEATINESGPNEIIFTLHNRGDAPITITQVVPSCGRCTVVGPPDPQTILPGGESKLRVVAHVPDVGESRSRIDIHHDGKGSSPVVASVLLKGREVDAPTTVRQPREIVVRGFVGDTVENELQILTRENRDTKPWIEVIESNAPNVAVQSLGVEESPGPTKVTVDRDYRYRVTAALDRRGRLPLAVLTARCASPAGGVAPTPIQVMSDSRASVEAVPDTIFASLAKSDLPREYRIRFRSPRLGGSLKIEPAVATATWFEIDPPTAQPEGSPFAAQMIVRITDLPDDSTSTTSKALVAVATNDEDCPKLEIPLHVRRRE